MVFPNSDSRFCVIMVFPNIFCTFDPRNCGLTGWWVNLSWIFCGVEPQNKCGWQQTKYGTYQNPNCYSFTKPIKPIFYWLQHDNMLQTNFCPSSLRSFPQGPSVAKQCKDQSVGITAGLLGCAERQQWRYIDYMDIYIEIHIGDILCSWANQFMGISKEYNSGNTSYIVPSFAGHNVWNCGPPMTRCCLYSHWFGRGNIARVLMVKMDSAAAQCANSMDSWLSTRPRKDETS